MDIRLLESRDIEAAKVLWKQAFGDSDAFINTYFRDKVLPGNSLGLFDRGLISVVHMIPYSIRVQGRPLQSAFIAGAATDKNRRGEGHMRTMLLESLKVMKWRGILLTHLYPFKHNFYENFGWATYSHVHKKTIKKASSQTDLEVIETRDLKMLQMLYENMIQHLDGYVIRGECEWKWRLDDLFIDGGKVIVLLKENEPIAYMMYYIEDGIAEVIEAVYSNESDAKVLGEYLLLQGHDAVNYSLVSKDSGATAHGMARVVDAKALLREFGAECLLEDVQIVDQFLDWNNIGADNRIKLTIGELAQLVHRGKPLHKLDNTLKSKLYQKASEFFVNRFTCIFEQY